MATQSGIGYSPLTEKVYMGRQNPQKRMWVGDKKDITNQFLAVLIEFVPRGTNRKITGGTQGEHLILNIDPKNKAQIAKAISMLQKLQSKLK